MQVDEVRQRAILEAGKRLFPAVLPPDVRVDCLAAFSVVMQERMTNFRPAPSATEETPNGR